MFGALLLVRCTFRDELAILEFTLSVFVSGTLLPLLLDPVLWLRNDESIPPEYEIDLLCLEFLRLNAIFMNTSSDYATIMILFSWACQLQPKISKETSEEKR